MRVTRYAMTVAMLAIASACATARPGTSAAASDTARSSLCLIDRALPVRAAPAAGMDDPGNRFDTDDTTEALLEHNARLRAACPSPDAE